MSSTSPSRLRPVHAALACAALGLALGAVAPGCTKKLARPDGARCEASSPEDATVCEGSVCLAFDDNVQGLPGMCTRPCSDADGCDDGGVCLGPFVDGGFYCMKICSSNFDCYDGAACVSGAASPFCWVTPV